MKKKQGKCFTGFLYFLSCLSLFGACNSSDQSKTNGADESEIIAEIILTDEPPTEVKIDSQIWMARNLNVGKFQNGEIIPQAKTAAEWKTAGMNKQPVWCCYNFDNSNAEKYGRLYNFYAVADPRGLAPAGWHIPSENEFKMLHEFFGGDHENMDSFNGIPGYAMRMRSKQGWSNNYNGTGDSGFNALPGGICTYDGGFMQMGANWWSSTQDTIDISAENRNASNCTSAHVSVDETDDFLRRDDPCRGLSVRCVKND